jgi:hypothetical protein
MPINRNFGGYFKRLIKREAGWKNVHIEKPFASQIADYWLNLKVLNMMLYLDDMRLCH